MMAEAAAKEVFPITIPEAWGGHHCFRVQVPTVKRTLEDFGAKTEGREQVLVFADYLTVQDGCLLIWTAMRLLSVLATGQWDFALAYDVKEEDADAEGNNRERAP